MKIQYILSLDRPQTNFIQVQLNIEGNSDEFLTLTMPAWTPGAYEISDFARFVVNLKAFSDDRELEVSKKDKTTWRIKTEGSQSIRVSYEVFAHQLDVHSSYVDQFHAFINGTSVFFYVDGYKEQSIELQIKPPEGWKVSTGMEKLSEFRYRSTNYDILVDCPIEIGTHRSLFFSVEGKEHEIVLCGTGNENEEKIKGDVKRIVEAFLKMFGHLPYKRYVFIYHLIDSSELPTGGLEHLNSTAIAVDRFCFTPFEKYRAFLSVTSHEFFHLWNVKRIRPVELGPFNYREENYTNMLWMAEGFTNFYGYHILMRAGLIDEKEYFRHLTENMRYYETIPGGRKTSAYDSSFDTWTKLYKPSPNNYNHYVSYYLKGELLGFLLDLKIIEITKGQKSLDDLYLNLMEKYNRDGKGYNEKDLIAALRDVTGSDFSDYITNNFRKAGNLDFGSELRKIGMVLSKGFKKIYNEEPRERPYLGLILKNSSSRFIVDGVLENSPAYQAGINPSDELVAVNGVRYSDRFTKEILEGNRRIKQDNMSDFTGREKVKVHLFRGGVLHEIEVPLAQSPYEYYEAIPDQTPLPDAEKFKQKFLAK